MDPRLTISPDRKCIGCGACGIYPDGGGLPNCLVGVEIEFL